MIDAANFLCKLVESQVTDAQTGRVAQTSRFLLQFQLGKLRRRNRHRFVLARSGVKMMWYVRTLVDPCTHSSTRYFSSLGHVETGLLSVVSQSDRKTAVYISRSGAVILRTTVTSLDGLAFKPASAGLRFMPFVLTKVKRVAKVFGGRKGRYKGVRGCIGK